MKRILVLCAALALLSGFVMAEGAGLTLGSEIGIHNFNEKNDSEEAPWVEPFLMYDSSFFDGVLGLHIKIKNKIELIKPDADDFNPMHAYFKLALSGSIFFTPSSTLKIIVENEVERFKITGRTAGEHGMNSVFKPAIDYNHKIGKYGSIYHNTVFPIFYLSEFKDLPLMTSLESTLGWKGVFGLGFWAKEVYFISPTLRHGVINLCVSFQYGPAYFEVQADIYNDTDLLHVIPKKGITIIPKMEFVLFTRFSAYFQCEIEGFNSDYEIMFSPSLGLSVSF